MDTKPKSSVVCHQDYWIKCQLPVIETLQSLADLPQLPPLAIQTLANGFEQHLLFITPVRQIFLLPHIGSKPNASAWRELSSFPVQSCGVTRLFREVHLCDSVSLEVASVSLSGSLRISISRLASFSLCTDHADEKLVACAIRSDPQPAPPAILYRDPPTSPNLAATSRNMPPESQPRIDLAGNLPAILGLTRLSSCVTTWLSISF